MASAVWVQPTNRFPVCQSRERWQATDLAEQRDGETRPSRCNSGRHRKRIGWHVFRHSFGTLIKSQGADVATTQALMRHANVSVTMEHYVQAITSAKRQA